jgi:hypothetical protein
MSKRVARVLFLSVVGKDRWTGTAKENLPDGLDGTVFRLFNLAVNGMVVVWYVPYHTSRLRLTPYVSNKRAPLNC